MTSRDPGSPSHRGIAFALLNFALAAIAGAIMRLAFVVELSWLDYKNVLHAHSHTAILGWATIGLFALFLNRFPNQDRNNRRYRILFLLLEIAVIGEAIDFALEGYAFWSILSSSLYVIFSYVFIISLLRDQGLKKLDTNSSLLAKTALYFLLFSTLFIWGIGPVIAAGLRFSQAFYLLVQAFLHFMINGWFIFGILALIFQLIESKNIIVDKKKFVMFYRFLLLSTFLTYALAVAWADPEAWVFILNSLGVLLQGIALVYFLIVISPVWSDLKKRMTRWSYILLLFAIVAFVLKILMQTVVVLPFLATVAYTIRYFVIGFLHLILLGVITLGMLAIMLEFKLLDARKPLLRTALIMICAGFIGSELLLFMQGTMAWGAMGFIPGYYTILFVVTCFLPIGVILLNVAYHTGKKRLLHPQ